MLQDNPIRKMMADTCLEELPNIEYSSREEAGEKQVVCYQKFISLYYLYVENKQR